jgi:DNA-binding transcriptional ArsR family regulator
VNPDAALRALAEPQRRRILELVRDGERPAGEIADHFAITPQAVSQHLRVLRDAGLLHERREGTRRLYAIRPEAIASVRAYLDELWPASLDRLRVAVEEDEL